MIPLVSKIVIFISLLAIMIAVASYIVFRYKERMSGKGIVPSEPLPEPKSRPLSTPSLPRIQPQSQPTIQSALASTAPLQTPIIKPQIENTEPVTPIAKSSPPTQLKVIAPIEPANTKPMTNVKPNTQEFSRAELTPSQSAFVNSLTYEDPFQPNPISESKPEREPSQELSPRRYVLPGMKTSATKGEHANDDPFDIRWKEIQ